MFDWSSHGREIVSNFYKNRHWKRWTPEGVSREGRVEQLIRTYFLCFIWHLSYLSGLCICVHQYVGLLTKNLALNHGLLHVLKK